MSCHPLLLFKGHHPTVCDRRHVTSCVLMTAAHHLMDVATPLLHVRGDDGIIDVGVPECRAFHERTRKLAETSPTHRRVVKRAQAFSGTNSMHVCQVHLSLSFYPLPFLLSLPPICVHVSTLTWCMCGHLCVCVCVCVCVRACVRAGLLSAGGVDHSCGPRGPQLPRPRHRRRGNPKPSNLNPKP